MLAAPTEKEELIMYLAAAKEAVSAVLITKREGKEVPIYFVSRALQGPKINYTSMEKLMGIWSNGMEVLPSYARSHVRVLSRAIGVSSRVCKGKGAIAFWAGPNLVKGKILADFIVERPEDDVSDTPMEEREELPDPWVLFTDGSSYIDSYGAGLIITNLEGMEFTYALRFRFNSTNNKQVLVEELKEKSIDEQEILAVVEEEGHTWMTSVHEYLTEGILPEEKKKARAIRRKAGRYEVINETLYKKSFLEPWLR
ncbi:reverse transcriptase domain-containing protein, partial [Tanacetum coccineum]